MVKFYGEKSDNVVYDKSETMNELIKIALNKSALPAPNPYQENKKTIEEKRLEPSEKSIMEVAHPEPVYIAESMGDGALVENEIENQKKMIEVINKMPTGNLVHRYAALANVLLKTAETCDELEEVAAADLLTDAAKKLLEKAKSPL
jgi:hypothetical protein